MSGTPNASNSEAVQVDHMALKNVLVVSPSTSRTLDFYIYTATWGFMECKGSEVAPCAQGPGFNLTSGVSIFFLCRYHFHLLIVKVAVS